MTKKHVKSAVAEQQELQEKFIQLQVMKQQAQSYLEEKQKVDSALTELTMTLEAMKKLKGAKKDNEIWPTLGSGAFITGEITDISNIMIGVGAGIVVKKSLAEATEVMEKRVADMRKVDGELMGELTGIVETIQTLEPEVEKLAEKLQKEGNL